jgi:CheY-like chemotaxis protein
MKILLLDDEKEIIEIVSEIVNDFAGIEGFSNPKEALEKIKTTKYDLFVLDIKMPGMTGIEWAKEARNLGINTPIIFMSAAGIDNFLETIHNIKNCETLLSKLDIYSKLSKVLKERR